MKIDLSLTNATLYENCKIVEVGGRLTLATAPQQASNMVGRNAIKMVNAAEDRNEVTLTGPMAVWAYLIVFHIVVHKFSKVYYDDERSGPVLIAMH